MKNTMYGFPVDLADMLHEKWVHYVAGDFVPPPIPNLQQLRFLLETIYLAGMETEEARPIAFKICCAPNLGEFCLSNHNSWTEAWRFEKPRPLTVQELRRLAPATDNKATAIWIEFSDDFEHQDSLSVVGLLNLGKSWTDARNAFSYRYKPLPHTLLIEQVSPGHMVVYQGNYHIASLKGGIIQVGVTASLNDLIGIYPLMRDGHEQLRKVIPEPDVEPVEEWYEFEWLAYTNVLFAIVNSIHLGGHGGTLILNRHDASVPQELLRIKYGLEDTSGILKSRFVGFMTTRHKAGDMLWDFETKGETLRPSPEMKAQDLMVIQAQNALVEACSFVGGLAGVDGAIVMNTDFQVKGFGAEIVLERVTQSKVYQIVGDPLKQVGSNPDKHGRVELDSEQFGMRHRSAMKLCAANSDLAIFVVSQDGGVSLIWNQEGDVLFRKEITTTNTTIPLA